jgi:hypothetical protein
VLDFIAASTGLRRRAANFVRCVRSPPIRRRSAKIGYTRCWGRPWRKLDLTTVGDLRFDKIEDRLMGWSHEFKALVVSKPRDHASRALARPQGMDRLCNCQSSG